VEKEEVDDGDERCLCLPIIRRGAPIFQLNSNRSRVLADIYVCIDSLSLKCKLNLFLK